MNKKGNTIFWVVIVCLLLATAYAGIKLGLQYKKPEWITIAGMVIITGSLIMFFSNYKESNSK